MRFIFLLLFVAVHPAHAGIPDFYQPLVITPPSNSAERLIDLTPAFEKAKQLNKPILIYLGAEDCPPCKQYTAFLEKHKEEMKSVLAKCVLVDIRTWLEGPKLVFEVYDKRYTDAEFKTFVGDVRHELRYPTFWYLTQDGKQARQLPQSSLYFRSVASHMEMLEGVPSSNAGANSQPTQFSSLVGRWKVQVGDEDRLRMFDVYHVLPISADAAALDAVYGWADKVPSYVDAMATLKEGKLHVAITTPASSDIEAEQIDANTFRGTFGGKFLFATITKTLEMSRIVVDLSNIDKAFADEEKDFGVPPTKTLTTTYDGPTPLSVPGVTTIKTLALKQLLDSANPPVLIDVLSGIPGNRMALPAAIWLGEAAGGSNGDAAKQARFKVVLEKLTDSDKSKSVVFYCLGVNCWLSYDASLHAVAEGYKSVYWYRGGWEAWRAAGLPFVRAMPYNW